MPVLPLELEREIFEIAFRFDHKNAAVKLNLSLIARRVKYWIDLVFYETVFIRSENHANKFLSLIAEKTPGFFAVAVKRLYLVYWVTAAQAVDILSKCTAVQHLGCFVDEEGCSDLPLVVGRLSLSQLSINLSHFLSLPVTSLTRVTHLDLIFWVPVHSPNISCLIQSLNHLPQLTHLALGFYPSAENPAHTKAICANLPNLRVVIVIRDDTLFDYAAHELPNVYSCDPRLVVIPRNTEIMIKNWEAVDSKSFDMWAHAESVMEKRELTVSADA